MTQATKVTKVTTAPTVDVWAGFRGPGGPPSAGGPDPLGKLSGQVAQLQAQLQAQTSQLQELQAQVLRHGEQLSPSIDWRPEPGDLAQTALWARFRDPSGRRTPWVDGLQPGCPELAASIPEASGDPISDLHWGSLRLTSLAMLLDWMRVAASKVDTVEDSVIFLKGELANDCKGQPFGPMSRRDRADIRAKLATAYGEESEGQSRATFRALPSPGDS